MKNRWLYTLLGTLSMVVVFFITRKNRRLSLNNYFPLKNAGKPDQADRVDDTLLENSKMVSEGSLYGVQYYNEMAEEQQ